MSKLFSCGICCMLISTWGAVQLAIMGCLFFFEAPNLFEDAEPEEYDGYDDFIKKTQENYFAGAINCWIASGIYVVTLLLSLGCMKTARSRAAREAKLQEDDEYVCKQDPEPKKKKKVV